MPTPKDEKPTEPTGIGRELRRGTLELLLLTLVTERPKYGYELVAELDERTGGGLALKEGTVYPVLYRLEDQGLVAPEWSQPDRGVPRKYYRLTPDGAARRDRLEEEWRGYRDHVDALLASSDRPATQKDPATTKKDTEE